jgi:hypothetical protein
LERERKKNAEKFHFYIIGSPEKTLTKSICYIFYFKIQYYFYRLISAGRNFAISEH